MLTRCLLRSQAIMMLERVSWHVDCGGVGLKGMQGVATREDIDKTLKLGMNHPMGPLQLGASSVLSLRILKH